MVCVDCGASMNCLTDGCGTGIIRVACFRHNTSRCVWHHLSMYDHPLFAFSTDKTYICLVQ